MRVLVYYAHPVETSFVAALHDKAVTTLRARGHEVDDCDLNVEGFNPVLTRQERIDYHDINLNRSPVQPYVDRLLRAEAIILVYPVWNFGFPAILKGVLDRVFLPGVSFSMGEDGSYSPTLHHIKKLAAVCTYGGRRWRAMGMSDPPRRCVTRMLRHLIDRRGTCEYYGHYGMNHTTPERRAAFLAHVEQRFSRW